MTRRFFARSASDKTDDWPYWFVADSLKSGLNVVQPLMSARYGYPPLRTIKAFGFLAEVSFINQFLLPYDAVLLSKWANENIGILPQEMWGDRK